MSAVLNRIIVVIVTGIAIITVSIIITVHLMMNSKDEDCQHGSCGGQHHHGGQVHT